MLTVISWVFLHDNWIKSSLTVSLLIDCDQFFGIQHVFWFRLPVNIHILPVEPILSIGLAHICLRASKLLVQLHFVIHDVVVYIFFGIFVFLNDSVFHWLSQKRVLHDVGHVGTRARFYPMCHFSVAFPGLIHSSWVINDLAVELVWVNHAVFTFVVGKSASRRWQLFWKDTLLVWESIRRSIALF